MEYLSKENLKRDLTNEFRSNAMSGNSSMKFSDILSIVDKEEIYDIDRVIDEIKATLVTSDTSKNCLSDANQKDYVVVTKDVLEQVLTIVKYGGISHVKCE